MAINESKIKEWYHANKAIHEKLSEKIKATLEELISEKNIKIHSISFRTKDFNSFREKILIKNYDNLNNQLTDLSGIRIIVYVESDLDKICDIVKDNFVIDEGNSVDKSAHLGIDRVGYKSIHYIAEFGEDRLKLAENKKFKSKKFEIQVRTILQHSWAEIQHDKGYKFSEKLTPELERRWKILAGTLELVDKEFNRIVEDIDNIRVKYLDDTYEEKLNYEINSITLFEYLRLKFNSHIDLGLKPEFYAQNQLFNEIKHFGIKTIKDFDKLIPRDFVEKYYESVKDDIQNRTLTNIVRGVLMVVDFNKFMEVSYGSNWFFLSKPHTKLLNLYGIEHKEIVQKAFRDTTNQDAEQLMSSEATPYQ